MAGKLRDGDEVRLIGSGGAPVLLTVGTPFSAREIEKRLATGEWRHQDDPEPDEEPGPAPTARTEHVSKPPADPGPGPKPRTEKVSKPSDDPGPGPTPRTEHVSKPGTRPDQEAAEQVARRDPSRPADGAPKGDWVAYVAGARHMSREDAAKYTKADLIEMVS